MRSARPRARARRHELGRRVAGALGSTARDLDRVPPRAALDSLSAPLLLTAQTRLILSLALQSRSVHGAGRSCGGFWGHSGSGAGHPRPCATTDGYVLRRQADSSIGGERTQRFDAVMIRGALDGGPAPVKYGVRGTCARRVKLSEHQIEGAMQASRETINSIEKERVSTRRCHWRSCSRAIPKSPWKEAFDAIMCIHTQLAGGCRRSLLISWCCDVRCVLDRRGRRPLRRPRSESWARSVRCSRSGAAARRRRASAVLVATSGGR